MAAKESSKTSRLAKRLEGFRAARVVEVKESSLDKATEKLLCEALLKELEESQNEYAPFGLLNAVAWLGTHKLRVTGSRVSMDRGLEVEIGAVADLADKLEMSEDEKKIFNPWFRISDEKLAKLIIEQRDRLPPGTQDFFPAGKMPILRVYKINKGKKNPSYDKITLFPAVQLMHEDVPAKPKAPPKPKVAKPTAEGCVERDIREEAEQEAAEKAAEVSDAAVVGESPIKDPAPAAPKRKRAATPRKPRAAKRGKKTHPAAEPDSPEGVEEEDTDQAEARENGLPEDPDPLDGSQYEAPMLDPVHDADLLGFPGSPV